MKKKIFSGVAVLAIAVVAALNVNFGMSNKEDMSLLTLANVEALAQEPNSGWYKVEITSTREDNGSVVSETKSVSCSKGGPSSSCTEGCQGRFKDGNGNWSSWRSC
jgi:hypothetical protein